VNVVLPHNFEWREYAVPFVRFMHGGGLRAFLAWHRRAGKDLSALHFLATMAAERVGIYWHMLPTARQTRRAIWNGLTNEGIRFVDGAIPPSLVRRRNDTEMLLELFNGSVIQFVGSDNYDSLVGSNPVGVNFSEFALSKPAAWNYIRPILAMNGGWAVFNTTPRGRNHAHDLWQTANQPDSGFFTQLLTVHDTNLRYPSARTPGTFLSPTEMMEEERRAGMPDAYVRSEYLCDWNAAMVGSVWGDLLELLAARGQEEVWDIDQDGVFTAWDLGMADATAIWFFRVRDSGIEFIDHYEGRGKPLSHYAEMLDQKGYRYIKHWLPHDAVARTLASQVSVLDQLAARFGRNRVAICPRLALLDGIQAGRWLLQQPETRFHRENCKAGLEALRQYHYEYDDETKMFAGKPEHDWSSHTADAFRYAAVVSRLSGIFRPRAVEPTPPPVLNATPRYTLDELWASHEKREYSRKRI
jgi:phage terminase large subunit